MKKKMLAAAIASALAVPSAFAAIDDAGMKYTSASEGFYGSLRFALQSAEDNDLSVSDESSRLGVQGDVDVGHGNTAFYRAEWRVEYDAPNASPFSGRLGYIGMRGNYGSVRFGQIWSAEYDYVFSLADVTNNVTGLISPTFRIKDALRYDSPDIQGFNFSLQAQANDRGDAFAAAEADASLDTDDGNEFDRYAVAASYSIRGINVAATYISDQAADDATGNMETPDEDPVFVRLEDSNTWGLGATYGQDNWKVGYVYRDTSDFSGLGGFDFTAHSLAGQVSFDKVTLRAVFETNELENAADDADSDIFTLEAQYSFSSKARAYINYQNRDTDAGGYDPYRQGRVPGDGGGRDEDTVYVAYRVDF